MVETVEGVKLCYICIHSIKDPDGNVIKIYNAEGQFIFRYKMIVTQAMLGESNTARELAYEVCKESYLISG